MSAFADFQHVDLDPRDGYEIMRSRILADEREAKHPNLSRVHRTAKHNVVRAIDLMENEGYTHEEASEKLGYHFGWLRRSVNRFYLENRELPLVKKFYAMYHRRTSSDAATVRFNKILDMAEYEDIPVTKACLHFGVSETWAAAIARRSPAYRKEAVDRYYRLVEERKQRKN